MKLKSTFIDGRYHIMEPLGNGGTSIVYKATEITTNQKVVLKLMKEGMTSKNITDIIRFRREIEIVSKFNHPNIITLYHSGEFNNQPYLAMEYLTGRNLKDILHQGHKFNFSKTLAIIKQIAEALIYVHHQRVIHRDLKPGNIFIDKETGPIQVKLLDFGIALAMELGAVQGDEVAGTFGYMSPEAIGILNNRIDERSDLYSLGIIFYQLLTGKLPFTGNNVNQIIHQQVALTPPHPRKINQEIPSVLEAMVLKLLQKDPDLRYQSAKGLLADLARYENGERQFEIGSQDPKITLTYQTRLVGRETELERIIELIGQTKSGCGSICLIAGEAGIGKSKIVEEIRHLVYEMDELFISGRCINLQNKTPYQPFKDAIDDYLGKLEKEENETKCAELERLKNLWADRSEIIIQLNSRLENYIGTPKKPAPFEADQRFLMIFADFICSLASLGKICILFLDDLQWADEGSFNLLIELLPKLPGSNLFILGTYRNNEITQNHGLERLKRQAKENGAVLSEIQLVPLHHDQINKLIANLLGESEAQALKLSGYIHLKSGGNPFFAIQIIRELIENKAICWKEGHWEEKWEVLNKTPVSGSMLDIILRRIENLNPMQKNLLSIGAIIGREFEIELLYYLTDFSQTTIVALIDECITQQLLERSLTRGKILFAHDRIRDAFYHQITEAERKEIHLQIARAIENTHDNLDEVIFDLGRHYFEGGDQEKTLQYMLPAAARAKKSWANEEAIKFYKIVINILESKQLHTRVRDKSEWLEAKENLIQLYLTLCKLDEARTITEQILPIVMDTMVKARIYKKFSSIFGAQGDWVQCKDNSIKGLELLGVNIPKNNFEITVFYMIEFAKHLLYRWFSGSFYLKSHNTVENEDKERVLLSFNLMLIYMYFDDPRMSWIALRMLNLSERNIGKSFELGISLVAYALVWTMSLLFKKAINYNFKALQINQELNNEWGISLSLIYLARNYCLAGKNDESIKHFEQAQLLYHKSGDVWQLKNILNGLGIAYYYQSDYNLSIKFLSQHLEITRKIKDHPGSCSSLVFLSACYIEKGDFQKAQEILAAIQEISMEGRPASYCALYFTGYLEIEQNNYRHAIENFEQVKTISQGNRFIKPDIINLFSAFADARMKRLQEIHSNNNTRISKQELKRLFHYCREATRETKPYPNHYGGALRAMANYYRLAGKHTTALKYFLKSIACDKKINRRFELAKDYLDYGIFLDSTYKTTQAREIWQKAYEIFKCIGAAEYTQKTIDLLKGTRGIAQASAQIQFFDERTTRERLKTERRMNTVLTTSRYLSSILDIDDLLQKIMESIIELMGAERGILFLYPKKGVQQLEIKAIRKISKEEFHGNGFTSSRSIISKVEKEKIPLIYMDAMADEELRTQSSIVSGGIRSVICAPIINKGDLLGVIYLDNNLLSGLFTNEDLNILDSISCQAGISIENARLYSKIKIYSKELEESKEKIAKWNQELEQCIHERTNELHIKNAELEAMNKELLTLNRKLQACNSAVEELAVAKERTRLAHDLHDTLGQLMTLSIPQLEASATLCEKAPLEAKEKLERITKLIREGLAEIRYSITGLIPGKFKTDTLIEALQSMIVDYQSSGLEVDFSVEGVVADELELRITDVIYRTCQEALTNSLKHGKAQLVMILLRFLKGSLKVYISDDGCGCKTIQKGLGLTGMEERIKSLGGVLFYGSDGENGFNLRLEVPILGNPGTNEP